MKRLKAYLLITLIFLFCTFASAEAENKKQCFPHCEDYIVKSVTKLKLHCDDSKIPEKLSKSLPAHVDTEDCVIELTRKRDAKEYRVLVSADKCHYKIGEPITMSISYTSRHPKLEGLFICTSDQPRKLVKTSKNFSGNLRATANKIDLDNYYKTTSFSSKDEKHGEHNCPYVACGKFTVEGVRKQKIRCVSRENFIKGYDKIKPIEGSNCIVQLSRMKAKKKLIYNVLSGPLACKFEVGKTIEMDIGLSSMRVQSCVIDLHSEDCPSDHFTLSDREEFSPDDKIGDPNTLYIDMRAIWAP